MRLIVFFDLPITTKQRQREYREFVKQLKKNGFYMLQESVYVKMAIDQQSASSTVCKLKSSLPTDGSVISLCVTEKQFSSMQILLGKINTDVLTTDERLVVL